MKESDFDRVYKQGERLKSPLFRLIYKNQTNQGATRLGIVVSKKAIPRIVDRNRLKRIVRAELATKIINFSKGFDIIIQANAGMKKPDPQQVRQDLALLLQKSRLFGP